MEYVAPELKISVFDTENIVTASKVGDKIEDFIPEGQTNALSGTVRYEDLQKNIDILFD